MAGRDKQQHYNAPKETAGTKLDKVTGPAPGFLAGGGDMGARIRAYDWGSSPLGAPRDWPQALKTTVRLLLSTGHPMFIWWGPDLIQFYNDAYSRSIGPERHPSALGQRGRECWGEIWDIIGTQIEQVMSGDGYTWHENQLVPITRYGKLEDVYWTYSYGPIDDPGAPNGVGGVLVVCTETTEQVLAERRMKAAEARWRELFNQAPGFMCILRGSNHVFEYANPRYIDLVGSRDVIGKPIREALPEVEAQGFVSILDHVYAKGEPYTGAATPVLLANARGGTSQQVFLDFVYQPIRDETGTVTGILVEGSDVTERVTAHNALQEADRKKDEFLAMLSHELRNPMAPIFNALHLMEGENESRIQRETRDVIERQMKHMSRLVNDLLEVTRITTGRVNLRIERVNLTSIINKAVERIRPVVDKQKQNIFFSPENSPLFLNADPTRLEQVIGNLLHNASKYNRPGGNIWIYVENGDTQVTITVRDDGAGIPPGFLPSIWDLFSQGEISPDRAEGGLGIGLALVKNLVELHGGRVNVSSEGEGNGSEFTILLPASTGKPGRPAAATSPGSRPMRPLRILVIDDHRDAARMTGLVVKSWGHDVQVVNSGAEALQCLQHFIPHAVLLDLGMPYMDGYEVARAIRSNPLFKQCPIIAITGYGQALDRRKSREAGINLHLTKPVEPAELKKVLMDQVALKTSAG